jgi:predicted ATPase
LKDEIMHFHSIEELQSYLGNHLKILKKKSEEYSEAIGEKIRFENTTNDPTEIAELKEKLEGPLDPKKKKTVKKRDQKTNWHELGPISVYDGIGTKGELEIYFKALEKMKSKIEKIEKIKDAIDNLISKGVKRELGCTAFLNQDLTLQVCFIKTGQPKTKFSYKSIFTIPSEIIHEVKI